MAVEVALAEHAAMDEKDGASWLASRNPSSAENGKSIILVGNEQELAADIRRTH